MSSRFLKRFDRQLMPAVLTAIIYGAFLQARLSVHGFEPSYFVVAGADQYDATSADPSLRAIRDGSGYDGQFYYRLAIAPFSKKFVDHGIRFDVPVYRQQRILYPLLAWIFSFGNPAWVPLTLILLNYVGLCLIAGLGGAFARAASRHAMWGMIFSLYPGFIFTLSRDLTEIVASTFFLLGLLLMHRSRHGLSAACLCLAVLARETTLVVPTVIVLRSTLNRRVAGTARNSVLYYAVPLVLYAGWRTYLQSVWANYPNVQIWSDAIGWPFHGLADLWSRAFATPNRLLVSWCAETCLIGAHVTRGIQRFWRNLDFGTEKISLVVYAGMLVCLTAKFWPEDQAFFRVTTEGFLLGSIALLHDRTRIQVLIYLLWIAAACFTFGWRVEW